MLRELCQLLRDGTPRSVSQLAAALNPSAMSMLEMMLDQLQRKGKISRCAPAMPCSKAGCGCDALDEPWYQWNDSQPIRL